MFVYIYLVPLITLITSRIVLNEKISFLALLGGILILSGLYISENGLNISFLQRGTGENGKKIISDMV